MAHGVGHAQIIRRLGDVEPGDPPTWGTPVDQETDDTGHTYAVGNLANDADVDV